MNVAIALGLIALGMCVDAVYERRIRVAECNAYETGYQCGLKENTIHKEITVPEIQPLPTADNYFVPSMDAPVEMPPTFEEKLKKHGRATAMIKRGAHNG
jgi:hypothetical protein